ncbi:hypothetical protein ANRL1_00869 [Anaerolineae bacterium]|nr:hypothetical protein ANRL1_00869 [Anaerolineae bacterium]
MKRQEKPISDKHRNQLEDARAALAKCGKSPRQIAHESRLKVVDWIYRWGCTSSPLIQELLGKSSGGYAQKLTRQGWLVATRTESGTPSHFFTLSEHGIQEAERHTMHLYRYPEVDPYRVSQQLLRHNLLAQQITANALLSGAIENYETERMFIEGKGQSHIKIPDVAWTSSSGLRIAVEVELSAKWGRNLDDFVLNICTGLQRGNGKRAQCDRFLIMSDSRAIIERYRMAMQPGTQVNIWAKNQRNHWVIDKTVTVPDWLIQKVDFKLLGE